MLRLAFMELWKMLDGLVHRRLEVYQWTPLCVLFVSERGNFPRILIPFTLTFNLKYGSRIADFEQSEGRRVL
jgi:hypothetical protein